jgi:hypothetical protein
VIDLGGKKYSFSFGGLESLFTEVFFKAISSSAVIKLEII